MSVREAKRFQTGLVGQLPSILLSPESNKAQVDLFTFSAEFYRLHRDVLPLGVGIVSGLWQLDQSGKRTLPPSETISFDARQCETGIYGWEIGYANTGVQQVVRLVSAPDSLLGDYIETDRAGAVVKYGDLNPDVLTAVKAHLLERLDSREVVEFIKNTYAKRWSIEQLRARAVASIALHKGNALQPRRLQEQADFYEKRLRTTGFTPQTVFNPSRLNHLVEY